MLGICGLRRTRERRGGVRAREREPERDGRGRPWNAERASERAREGRRSTGREDAAHSLGLRSVALLGFDSSEVRGAVVKARYHHICSESSMEALTTSEAQTDPVLSSRACLGRWDSMPSDIIVSISEVIAREGGLSALRLVSHHWCASIDSSTDSLVLSAKAMRTGVTAATILEAMSKTPESPTIASGDYEPSWMYFLER